MWQRTDPAAPWPAHGASDAVRSAFHERARQHATTAFLTRLGIGQLAAEFADQLFERVAADPLLCPWFGADLATWRNELVASLAARWHTSDTAPAETQVTARTRVPAQTRASPTVPTPPDDHPAGWADAWSILVDLSARGLNLPALVAATLYDRFRRVAHDLVGLPDGSAIVVVGDRDRAGPPAVVTGS